MDGEDNISIDLQGCQKMFQSNDRVAIYKFIKFLLKRRMASHLPQIAIPPAAARYVLLRIFRTLRRETTTLRKKKKKQNGENGRASPRREEEGTA